jgi:hypothetical protein
MIRVKQLKHPCCSTSLSNINFNKGVLDLDERAGNRPGMESEPSADKRGLVEIRESRSTAVVSWALCGRVVREA